MREWVVCNEFAYKNSKTKVEEKCLKNIYLIDYETFTAKFNLNA